MSLAVALVMLAGAAVAADPAHERAKESVKAELIDPWSAQFKQMKTAKGGMVCGLVNSKNRMGGYAGWLPFMVLPSGSVMLMPTGSDIVSRTSLGHFDALFREACGPDR